MTNNQTDEYIDPAASVKLDAVVGNAPGGLKDGAQIGSMQWLRTGRVKIAGVALVGLGAAVTGYMLLQTPAATASTKQMVSDADSASKVVVSIINGQPVYEAEITPMLSQYPKAVAVDGYINKVLTAQEMQKNIKWSDEAAKRVQAASREVLSQMYFEKVGGEVSAAVTDEDVADFYVKNISEAMFAKYSASYSLYADPESAAAASKAIVEGDKEGLKSFKSFQDDKSKDASFTVQQFPYDLGRVIQALKVQEYSQPLPTRNGYFIVRLDHKTDGKKPEVKEIRGQIVQAIVQQKMSLNVAALRAGAKIELK